jgi:hypothetical protein
MNPPRVFEEGTVTLVVGPQGCSIYAGPNEVRLFSGVELKAEEGGRPPELVIRFQYSHDKEVSIQMDAERRLVRALGWPGVAR